MKKKSSSVKRKNLKNSIFNPQTKNKRIKKIYERFEFLINQKEFKGYLVAVSGPDWRLLKCFIILQG